jgi:thiol:disulfide interchange protein DsbD
MRTALIIILLTIGTLSSPAAPSTKGIDLQLLSEVTAIQPGKAFTVGLHIRHHDGFHTYWQNPGVVGIPTQLDWSLPDGFSAGPIQWPYPKIVDMAGHPAHGFHRDVLLMADITPPETIDAKTVTLEANATWMACAKSCHPDNTKLALTLPIAETSSPDTRHDQKFKNARQELPQPMESWNITLLSPPNAPTIHLRLTPKAGTLHALSSLYFFSSDGQVSSDQPQQLDSPAPGTYDLVVKRAEFGPEDAAHLPGILLSSSHLGPERQKFGSINPRFPDKKTPPTP